MEKETEKTEEKQNDKPWLFKKGQSGNPKGRPKGTFSLKTYAKKYLEEMTDEEKLEFMEGLPKDVIWKMAEGNPDNKSELTGKDGQPLEIKVINYGANNNTPQLPTKEVPNTDIQSD